MILLKKTNICQFAGFVKVFQWAMWDKLTEEVYFKLRSSLETAYQELIAIDKRNMSLPSSLMDRTFLGIVLVSMTMTKSPSRIPEQFESNERFLSMIGQRNHLKNSTRFRTVILESSSLDTNILPLTICEREPVSDLIETDHCVLLFSDAAHCMPMFRGECKYQMGLSYQLTFDTDGIHVFFLYKKEEIMQ
ncbi:hypothetical protein K501DRAFT_266016 [Backusella circina FSU 941]|nr:hypothetical protein K501DRAFT_266016 [Backusella circina FSU 941]